MKKCAVILPLILMAGLASSQGSGGFTTKWSNGFSITDNDRFSLKFGGRIMYDYTLFSTDEELENAVGGLNDGVRFRRARLYSSGTVYSSVNYKFQLDFAGGKISFKDVFIELADIPVLGNIRVGHFKEPLRLEVLTSSKYINFMERSFAEKFVQERNTGIMIHNHAANNQIFWQLGFFRNGDGSGDDRDAESGTNVTVRVAGTPIWDTETRTVLHLGAGVSFRNPTDNEFSVNLIPESSQAPTFASSGTIGNTDNVTVFALEAALVFGSFSAQTEFLGTSVDAANGSSYNFSSFYGQVSYFLTGEALNYKSSFDGFDRVKPNKNFGEGGAGAWQLALRYSNADLLDGNPGGGKLSDITFGINWHLNPVTRIMFNYVYADLDAVGTVDIFQTRFQIDF